MALIDIFFRKAKKIPCTVLTGLCLVSLIFSSHGSAAEFIDTALYAIENSPELNIALKDVELAQADEKVALSKYLPQLTGKIEGGAMQEEYEDSTNSYGDYSSSLSLSQDVVDMSKIYAIQSARKGVDVAKANLIQITQDVLLELAIDWGAYWKALRQQDINSENMKILKAYLAASKTRYEAGELTVTDVRLAEARFQTSLSQKIRFSREVHRTREALEDRIGNPPPREVTIFEMNIDTMEFPEINDSIRKHPSMIPLKTELSGLEIDINQQKAGHLPTLEIVGRYKYQPHGEYDSNRYPYDESYIGLELDIPIYSGGNIYNLTKKAVSQKNQQLLKISELRRELTRDIRTAKSDFEQSAEEEAVAKKHLEYTEETLKWMIEEFDAGTRTSVDIFLSQAAMITSKLEVIAAKEQHIRFIFNYLHSVGMLNIDTLKHYQAM